MVSSCSVSSAVAALGANLLKLVHKHAEEAVTHVQEYLNIDMAIASEATYPSLVDMALRLAEAANE